MRPRRAFLDTGDYLLKAVDAASAARWVEVLNQLKTNATNVVPPEKQASADSPEAWAKSSRGLLGCFPCCAH